MNKEDLTKIKKWLPRGYAKKIAEETGLSLVTIYNTINGHSENQDIINLAIDIALKEQQKSEQKKNLISLL